MSELTEADVSVLRMMAGANLIGGSITLPSGQVLDANEMQALTSFYAKPYERNQSMSDPREDWDMNRDGGSAWQPETSRETCGDRIKAAAREAGDKARRVFGKKRK